MHWLLPFAAPASDAGRQALRALVLPTLAGLIARAAPPGPDDRDEADELSFSPPHERALARLVELAGGDGTLPWAAWLAERDGLAPGDQAWGLLTPAHWQLGTDTMTMADPAALQLAEDESRALLAAVHDLFASEGLLLVWGAPLRWYLAHESLAALRTASADRVIGRSVDAWVDRGPAARLWRRLHSEAQMRLHEHPVNAAREARGLPAVNALWLSGCGIWQPTAWPPGLVVDERLRGPALAEDWAAWSAAWQALDAGPLAELAAAFGPVALTLCGERVALTLHLDGKGPLRTWVARTLGRWRQPAPAALLETL